MPGRPIQKEASAPLSQTQEFGMVPVYEERRGGRGPLLGYKFDESFAASQGKIDVPKPPEILAEEKRLGGKELEPIYAKGNAGGGRGGNNIVEYGAPIGYRYDNGNSEYVNFDASGKYQGTAKRQHGIDPAMLAILAMPFVGPALFEALGLTGAAGAEGLASLGTGATGIKGTSVAMGGGFGTGAAAGAAEGLAGTGALGAGGTGLTAGGAGLTAGGAGALGAGGTGLTAGGAGLTAGGAGAAGMGGGTGLSALASLSPLATAPLTEAGLGALGMGGAAGTGLKALASLSPIAGAPLVDAGLGALGMGGAAGTGLKALPSLSPVAGAPLVDALGAAGAAGSLGKLGVSDLLNAGKLLTLGSVVGKGLSGGSGGGSGTSGTSTIPEFTANRTQLAYDVDKKGVNPNTPYRPGQGGVTYFSPITYTPKTPKAAVEDVKAADGEKKVAGGGLMSLGGMSNLGSYSDGGRLLQGPGDGVSDSIPAIIGKKQPARLANGEFVIPARIVSELGNGSTDAGAKRLYEMMDRIQKVRRKTKNVAANTKAAKYLPA